MSNTVITVGPLYLIHPINIWADKPTALSENIIVNENYVLHVPEKLDLASAAPLLCAGITVYSPLKHWKPNQVKSRHHRIGGLGHMAIKIAKAMELK